MNRSARRGDGRGFLAPALALFVLLAVGASFDRADAQALDSSVRGASDGLVVFEYDVDDELELCANGSVRWKGSWSRRSERRTDCAVGVAEVALRVRGGVVTDIDIGPPGHASSSVAVDLGQREPQEVADFFLRLVRESVSEEVAEDALMPAVIAERVTVWPELDGIARDDDLARDVRESAVFWLSQVEDERALDALVSILEDLDDEGLQEKAVFGISQHDSPRAIQVLKGYAENREAPEATREHAIFWLGQHEGGGRYVRDLYGSLEGSSLKKKAIFAVSQSGSEDDGEWLLQRALDSRESTEVRKDALFWAGQSGVEASRLAALYSQMADREMKERVIFALSQSSDQGQGVQALKDIALAEADADLQKKALFWLGQTDDPSVPEFLLRLIRTEPTR